MEAPQNRRFKVWSASPFAIGERRTTFVNMLLGTCQELGELFALTPTLILIFFNGKKAWIESRLSTVQVENEQWTVHSPHRTQIENKKKTPLPPPPQAKKREDLHPMTQLLIGCMETLNPKIACHYFWPGLIEHPTY